MKFPISRILCTLAGLTAVLGSQPTLADDSEVFTSSISTTGAGARPNVLFVIDTSGSMDSEVTVYDPAQSYTGSCDAGYVYWGTTNTSVPAGRPTSLGGAGCRSLGAPTPSGGYVIDREVLGMFPLDSASRHAHITSDS